MPIRAHRCRATLFVTLLGIPAVAGQAMAEVIHVPGDFETIQDAIAAPTTADGDEIVVAPGDYEEQIDFLGKSIAVTASGGPLFTRIDGGGGGTVITATGGEHASVCGFTVAGGDLAMRVDGSGATVADCWFEDNVAGIDGVACDVVLVDCAFTAHTGAAIELTSAALYVLDSIFLANAGGVIVLTGATATIDACTFDGDGLVGLEAVRATNGSDLEIVSSEFRDLRAELVAGVWTEDSDVSIAETTFDDNEGTYTSTVLVVRGSVTLDDCAFEDNVGGEGGAVDVFDAAFVAADLVVEGNSAAFAEGGGIALTRCTVDLRASGFRGNTTVCAGGGLSLTDVVGTVTACVFDMNEATNAIVNAGGGAYVTRSTVTFDDCAFRDNRVPVPFAGGGGLGAEIDVDLTLVDCVFEGNDAERGAGVAIHEGAIDFERCTLAWNTAIRDGGGVYAEQSVSTYVDCVFDSNAADHGGGVFDVGQATMTGCVFDGNSARVGGGARLFGSPVLTACVFEDNEVYDAEFSASGGALHLQQHAGFFTPIITDCSFEGNGALGQRGYGGALWFDDVDVSVSGCVLVENTASYRGGAIWINAGDRTAFVAGSLFCGNDPESISGDWLDEGGNTFSDFERLLQVLAHWGPCPVAGRCAGDVDGNGVVDFVDLLEVLAAWGQCPG